MYRLVGSYALISTCANPHYPRGVATSVGASAIRARLPWPVVGRDDELMWAAAAQADPDAHGIVLSGAAGVGKTRLAREVVGAAARRGAPIEWVQATVAAASIPLGAVVGLVPAEVRTDNRLHLFQLCVDSLRERGSSERVVLALDDAHLLDPASAALVLHVAMSKVAFVVVTLRTGEPCPDSIVALWKDLGTSRLELQDLSVDETGGLLEAALGGEVATSVRRWAFEASNGHPLYLRELVNGALASGALVSEEGTWQLRANPGASPALVDLISRSLNGLAAPELDTARLLALGEPLAVAVVGDVMGGIEPLGGLEDKGLALIATPVGAGEETEARLGHPLYGDVVRAGIPHLRGIELRTRLAMALRARGLERPGDALRVATLLDDAGAALDDGLLLAAARDALSVGDADLAERLALRVPLGPETALILAAAYVHERRFDDAAGLLAAWDPRELPRDLALEYVERRAIRTLHFGLLRSDEARAVLDGAQVLFNDRDWIDRLEVMRLQVSISGAGGGPAEAVVGLGRLLERPDLPPDLRRQASIGRAMGLWQTGQIREALSASASLLPILPLRDATDANALSIWCIFRQESGHEWPELGAWLADADRDSARANTLTRGEIVTFLAWNVLERGMANAAARRAREAIEILERFDTVRRLPFALLILATGAARAGDVAVSRQALVDYETAIGEVPRPYWRLYREEVTSLAALMTAEGDGHGAISVLLAAASATERVVDRSRLLYEAMRAGSSPVAVAEPLREAARATEAPLARLFAGQAAAQSTGNGSALLATADEFGAIGAWLWAAESAALAARAFDDDGRQDSARRAAALGARLLEPCEGVHSPVLSAVALAPADLTRREQEIVALAARGASNAEIAERLVLSVRTVESHLYRAMRKLGVGSRQDLGEV